MREEPADERFLDVILDDQELVDLAFWMVIREQWPSVVKAGCTTISPISELIIAETGQEGEPSSASHHKQRSWARSPP